MTQKIEVSIYTGVKDTAGRKITVDVFIAAIKSQSSITGTVIQAREYLNNGDKENYNKLKNTLPAITPSGVFPPRLRQDIMADDTDNFKHTGLLGIDIDHTVRDYGIEPQAINNHLKEFSGYRGSYITTSGDGCRIYVMLHAKPQSQQHHRQAYYQLTNAIKLFLKDISGYVSEVLLDGTSINPSRINFASYDPNADWQGDKEDYFEWVITNEEVETLKPEIGRPKELPTTQEKIISVLDHIVIQDKSGYRHSTRVRVGYALKNLDCNPVVFDSWSDKQPFGDTATDNYNTNWWSNLKERVGSSQAGMGTLVELAKQTTDFSVSFDEPELADEREWVLLDYSHDILAEVSGKDLRLWLCDEYGYWQDYNPSFKGARVVVPPLKYMLHYARYKRGFFGDFSLRHTSDIMYELAVIEAKYGILPVMSSEFNDRNRHPYMVTNDNKVYRLDTGTLIEDKETIRSMKITVDTHRCPPIDLSLSDKANDFADWFWNHYPEEVWNILADSMHHTTKDIPQILFPLSNSGKGTLITSLKMMLGDENVQSAKSSWLSAKNSSSFDYDKRALSTSLIVVFDEISRIPGINMDKFHRLADPVFDNVDTKSEHPKPMRRTANPIMMGADFIHLDPNEQGVNTRLNRVIKVVEGVDTIDADKYLELTASEEGDLAIRCLRAKLIDLSTKRYGVKFEPTALEQESLEMFFANRTDIVSAEIKAMLEFNTDGFVATKRIKELSEILGDVTSQALNARVLELFPQARITRNASTRGFKGISVREDYVSDKSLVAADKVLEDASIPGFDD